MAHAVQIRRANLGSTDRAAIRAVLTMFNAHGWRDSHGAALALVDALTSHPDGLTPSRLAGRVPHAFLDENRLSRSRLEAALRNLTDGQ